ncbi:hypothetical protein [Marinobacterium lutimaris]|uniref:Uncharacterized protein n=1 Tax=Marinobacterium lutimaris TaxID=568106 RepID=A0A1H6BF99_9GAMM|nr:hypothetical protein [Marinobacterium lutimaris]SEG59342.1 hypothetical protein SAMN05444390_102620 [Marinobacterium lutimaris]
MRSIKMLAFSEVTLKRATKINIQDAIIEAIVFASKESFENTGVHIRKMPEYYLNVLIAHRLTNIFPSLGYRLEMPVKEALLGLGVNSAENGDDLRDGGRFDIVLTSKKSRKLRHVIEVKRSLSNRQLLKDAKRLKALATERHQSKRLETGFIATVSRLKISPRANNIDGLLDTRMSNIQRCLGSSMNVSCRFQVLDSGLFGFPVHESLVVTVFCLQKS